MSLSRRRFLQRSALAAAGLALPISQRLQAGAASASEFFQPTDASLARYQCPDWFRDAKFGIWAVWGPESVPEQGDWYARHMYEQGSDYYNYHVKTYGHPSKVGYKDVIPHFKAERWDPDRLMDMYKTAGAKYFCMIAMHHDNFDCWNSTGRRWNSVNNGPHRDIAREWQTAARKHGLRFGMTEHLAASWWFYSASKGSDKTGPLAGVPYDGTDPSTYDLYWQGNEHPNGNYYLPNAPAFVKEAWFDRITDLIDKYHPDLLYSDSPLPYPDDYGRALLAHYYNDNMARNKGALEAIYNCKEDSQGRWVRDFERGVDDNISPYPWQTDTCVGDWYYKRSLYENHQYKTTETVLHMLADIVSKNGNLLLNFPLRGDGTLDADEQKILSELAAWMPINGEAIFGSRPWSVYGEGPLRVKGGMFNEGKLNYTAQDIRFTQKDGALFALMLGWPEDGQVCIRSLGQPAQGGSEVQDVRLLGYPGKLSWTQTTQGLNITLPPNKPCDFAYAFKIAGRGLKPVDLTAAPVVIQPSANDGAIVLNAAQAVIHGTSPRLETKNDGDDIGYWDRAADYVSWDFDILSSGTYSVSVSYSCAPTAAGSAFTAEAAGQSLIGTTESTGSWDTFVEHALGTLSFAQTGSQTLAFKPQTAPPWKAVGLRSITLTKSA